MEAINIISDKLIIRNVDINASVRRYVFNIGREWRFKDGSENEPVICPKMPKLY